MSVRHPVVAITGSSGAGTTSTGRSFQHIFRREKIKAAFAEGDAFHLYDRKEMRARKDEPQGQSARTVTHFGPDGNLFRELETLFRTYGENGRGRIRRYLHDDAPPGEGEPGTFTPWEEIPPGTDLLFYEGLHGGVATSDVDVARYTDLLIGVVPIINLEWIQKIHRDRSIRGYSTEAVVDSILRRMPDYVRYICPQFSRTHVNFQRVPTVDTSNPFVARFIPSADESFLIIRFRDPKGIDFPYLLSMLHGSFMSRPNCIVVPGGKMELAIQLIFTPMVLQLMDRKRRSS